MHAVIRGLARRVTRADSHKSERHTHEPYGRAVHVPSCTSHRRQSWRAGTRWSLGLGWRQGLRDSSPSASVVSPVALRRMYVCFSIGLLPLPVGAMAVALAAWHGVHWHQMAPATATAPATGAQDHWYRQCSPWVPVCHTADAQSSAGGLGSRSVALGVTHGVTCVLWTADRLK